MGDSNFREYSFKNSHGSTGFFKVLGLTLIIVSTAFLITITNPFDKNGETSATTTSDTSVTSESSSSVSSDSTSASSTSESTTATTTTSTSTTTQKSVEAFLNDEMLSLINVKYLPVNEYSRVGEKRTSTKYIVVHYIGWSGNIPSTAEQNWQYFKNLATTHATSVSANFIIGMDGEIIQCMPLNEIAYANYPLNEESISIECCHPEKNGKFTEATYNSLVKLVSWLCYKYGLGSSDVIRHYDVRRKLCPLYWAGDPGTAEYDRWLAFKEDLLID